jgi:hypothetical protein
MRTSFLSAAVAALLFSLPAAAQKVQVFGGNSQRSATTVVLFGEGVMGGLSIVHGAPAWKVEYDAMLEKLKGKINRLGKDWWTTFTTSTELTLGGTRVPAGSYVLGLACDKDGKFSLAVLDAGKAMKGGVMPWSDDWQPDFSVPLTFHKDAAAAIVEPLTITLKADAKNLAEGSLTIAWGKHTLTATMAIHIAKQ